MHGLRADLQTIKHSERTRAALLVDSIDALLGHRCYRVVAGLGCLPTGATGIADGKDLSTLYSLSIFRIEVFLKNNHSSPSLFMHASSNRQKGPRIK